MNGALGRHSDVAVQTADQQLADFARPPMRLVALEIDDQPLHLIGQLVGIAHRPARAIAQRVEPFVLVAVEDLVTGLAGDAELLAQAPPSSPRPGAGR